MRDPRNATDRCVSGYPVIFDETRRDSGAVENSSGHCRLIFPNIENVNDATPCCAVSLVFVTDASRERCMVYMTSTLEPWIEPRFNSTRARLASGSA